MSEPSRLGARSREPSRAAGAVSGAVRGGWSSNRRIETGYIISYSVAGYRVRHLYIPLPRAPNAPWPPDRDLTAQKHPSPGQPRRIPVSAGNLAKETPTFPNINPPSMSVEK